MAADCIFLIRLFSKSDLAALHRLIADTIERCYIGVYPPKAIRYFLDYHAPENVLRDAEAGITLVGWLDEKPVVTATLTNNYVCRVFVHPKHQGQGFGTKIAEDKEKLAVEKGIQILKLDASLTSRRFWERLGWRVAAHEVEMVEDQPLEYFGMTKTISSTEKV